MVHSNKMFQEIIAQRCDLSSSDRITWLGFSDKPQTFVRVELETYARSAVHSKLDSCPRRPEVARVRAIPGRRVNAFYGITTRPACTYVHIPSTQVLVTQWFTGTIDECIGVRVNSDLYETRPCGSYGMRKLPRSSLVAD